jgi:hypothetical protein
LKDFPEFALTLSNLLQNVLSFSSSIASSDISRQRQSQVQNSSTVTPACLKCALATPSLHPIVSTHHLRNALKPCSGLSISS